MFSTFWIYVHSHRVKVKGHTGQPWCCTISPILNNVQDAMRWNGGQGVMNRESFLLVQDTLDIVSQLRQTWWSRLLQRKRVVTPSVVKLEIPNLYFIPSCGCVCVCAGQSRQIQLTSTALHNSFTWQSCALDSGSRKKRRISATSDGVMCRPSTSHKVSLKHVYAQVLLQTATTSDICQVSLAFLWLICSGLLEALCTVTKSQSTTSLNCKAINSWQIFMLADLVGTKSCQMK